MKFKNGLRKGPFLAAAAVAAASLAGGVIALTGGGASAATLTHVSLSVSNNAANVAGSGTTNTAIYTWAFTTKTVATFNKITFSVPAGTSGTLTPTVYGITGCTTKTAAVATTLVTLTLAGCAATAATSPVEVSISGFKNGTAATTGTSTITTYAATVAKDTGRASYTFANNTTAVTVTVPDSLTFTNSATAVTLLPIPGGAQVTATALTLKVKTNAKTGYKLTGCVVGTNKIKNGTGNTIPQQATAVTTLATGVSAFGAKAAVSGTGGTLGATWSTTKYLGYGTACAATTGHSTIMKSTGPVATNTLTLTNAARLAATQAAGTYSGTISYQLTPSY
jgi:hypothetical protein